MAGWRVMLTYTPTAVELVRVRAGHVESRHRAEAVHGQWHAHGGKQAHWEVHTYTYTYTNTNTHIAQHSIT
jgi:hypothetical protein